MSGAVFERVGCTALIRKVSKVADNLCWKNGHAGVLIQILRRK